MLVRDVLRMMVAIGALCSAGAALAEPASPVSGQPAPASEPLFATASRKDLAFAYLRFEQAYFQKPPAPEARADLNKEFDGITGLFFTQRAGEAIRRLNAARLSMLSEGLIDPKDEAVESLRVMSDPAVWVQDPLRAGPSIEIQSLYDVREPMDLTLTVQVRPGGGTLPVYSVEVPASFGPGKAVRATLPLDNRLMNWPIGAYDLAVIAGDRPAIVKGRMFVSKLPLSAIQHENDQLLQLLAGNGDTLLRPIEMTRARNNILSDDWSDEKSVQFLTNPILLAAEIANEIRQIDETWSPYRLRMEDYWRSLTLPEGRVLPMRVYLPPDQRLKARRLPLVIALHGAGGDESMFMEGYGSGAIKRLAAQYGFLVVSPQTVIFGSDPTFFDALVNDLAIDYPIDRSRIYVLGHSMGAIAAAGLASARGEVIAAAACIAGFREVPVEPKPAPMLVVAGALDPIIPLERMREAKTLSERGAPIEYREKADQGHTLIVADTLPEVVAWLLEKRLAVMGPAAPGR